MNFFIEQLIEHEEIRNSLIISNEGLFLAKKQYYIKDINLPININTIIGDIDKKWETIKEELENFTHSPNENENEFKQLQNRLKTHFDNLPLNFKSTIVENLIKDYFIIFNEFEEFNSDSSSEYVERENNRLVGVKNATNDLATAFTKLREDAIEFALMLNSAINNRQELDETILNNLHNIIKASSPIKNLSNEKVNELVNQFIEDAKRIANLNQGTNNKTYNLESGLRDNKFFKVLLKLRTNDLKDNGPTYEEMFKDSSSIDLIDAIFDKTFAIEAINNIDPNSVKNILIPIVKTLAEVKLLDENQSLYIQKNLNPGSFPIKPLQDMNGKLIKFIDALSIDDKQIFREKFREMIEINSFSTNSNEDIILKEKLKEGIVNSLAPIYSDNNETKSLKEKKNLRVTFNPNIKIAVYTKGAEKLYNNDILLENELRKSNEELNNDSGYIPRKGAKGGDPYYQRSVKEKKSFSDKLREASDKNSSVHTTPVESILNRDRSENLSNKISL